jgi:hypothetical protein
MASSRKKPEIKTQSPQEIPEVHEFLGALGLIEAFRAQHASVFTEFDKLVDNYNTKLEAATQIVRSKNVSSGPFELYQFQTKYDPKTLYDLLGHERFFVVGGATHTETVYTVDAQKVEMAIDQGKIPIDMVDSFRTLSPRYHAPKKIEL